MKLFKLSLISLLLVICLGTISCKDDDDNNPNIPEEEYVELDKNSVELQTGQTIQLTPHFSSEIVKKKDFAWSTDNPEVVKIDGNNESAIITALKEGDALVKFGADNGSIFATCQIKVTKAGDGVIRILGIGNSFTVDVLENNYLYELATTDGKEVIIAYLQIGGADLEEHLQNAKADKKVYQYTKRDRNGGIVNLSGKSIADGVSDEEWDYISFQQQSWLSGQFDSYEPYIPDLVNYVKSKSQNSNTTYSILQTWAFAYNYTNDDFSYYDKNQLTMYKALVDAADRASNLVEPKMMVIPAGTAIQNGRTSIIGDKFCRDGYHLDVNIGRFTAACAFYEAIFKTNVAENTYKPQNISKAHVEIAKNAAHYAIVKPKEVTEMVNFQE